MVNGLFHVKQLTFDVAMFHVKRLSSFAIPQ